MNKSTLNVIGCYTLWGLLPIFWKLLSGVNSAYVLAQRVIFSCIFCLAVILIKKRGGEIKNIVGNKSERRKFFLCGILMYISPTLQLLVGVFIYNEAFTQTNAVTFAFVWVAVILFVYDSFRRHRMPAAADKA